MSFKNEGRANVNVEDEVEDEVAGDAEVVFSSWLIPIAQEFKAKIGDNLILLNEALVC